MSLPAQAGTSSKPASDNTGAGSFYEGGALYRSGFEGRARSAATCCFVRLI